MTELPREQQSSIWPLGDYALNPAPEHPVLQTIEHALEPLRPLLRHLEFDAAPVSPVVSLGLGAEFHLASIRLLDEDTLLIDLPVGEDRQTAANLQRLLSTNLRRTWPLRVDSVTTTPPLRRSWSSSTACPWTPPLSSQVFWWTAGSRSSLRKACCTP